MPFEEAELKKALVAFRKRVKMLQLEQDSKLGRSPLTGKKEEVMAIRPPSGFGTEIWRELALQGHLKDDGQGFYTMVKKPS